MKRIGILAASLIAMTGGVAGCRHAPGPTPLSPDGVPAGQGDYVDQNWDPPKREWFYHASQGSQLIPYKWYQELEAPIDKDLPQSPPDSSASGPRFKQHLTTRYNYLPESNGKGDKADLPVGFAIDVDAISKESWVGMTCAACHTQQMVISDPIANSRTSLQIDGGRSNADLQGMLTELGMALDETQREDKKFDRFAHKVLVKYSPDGSLALRGRLRQVYNRYFAPFVTGGKPTLAWGPGRADAFGMIFNRVTSVDFDVPSNWHRPNAPVRYPALWDTNRNTRVQWNAVAPNRTVIERTARNAGEVLGVFARLNWQRPTNDHLYYSSSLRRINLLRLDHVVGELRSPRWIDQKQLPKIVEGDVKAGKIIYYRKEQCNYCHGDAQRNSPSRIEIRPWDVGTDPEMALQQKIATIVSSKLMQVKTLAGPAFGDQASSFDAVADTVGRSLIMPVTYNDKMDWAASLQHSYGLTMSGADTDIPTMGEENEKTAAEILENSGQTQSNWRARVGKNRSKTATDIEFLLNHKTTEPPLGYEARALNGIWTAAPFLHNGSVPNLDEFFKPAELRVKRFGVGSREFDPRTVGFNSALGDGVFTFDTSLAGNHNDGHSGWWKVPTRTIPGVGFGTDLSELQKAQLIAYLKSL